MTIAVIADIVGSRSLGDRASAQAAFDAAIARVDSLLPAGGHTLRPTVGDEQQGTFASLELALAWLLLLQLSLPDGLEFRFGIGIGAVRAVPAATGALSDGPGWWAARAAIERVHALQQRAAPTARTWTVAAPEEDERMHAAASLANAYLLARDQLVTGMNERARRLTLGRCLGRTQAQLAAEEGITQPAVSQVLASAGAASVVEGFRALGATAGERR